MNVALGVEADAHVHQVRRDVQDVGYDLRDRGLVSLALRHGTNGDDHFAVDVELGIGRLRVAGERRLRVDDLRLPEVIGAGIERGADADSQPASLGLRLCSLGLPLFPADQLLRYLQHARDNSPSRRCNR